MRGKPAVLAVVFDCDETLLPDPTSQLLLTHGLDPAEFLTKHVQSGSTTLSIRPLPFWGLSLSTSAPAVQRGPRS